MNRLVIMVCLVSVVAWTAGVRAEVGGVVPRSVSAPTAVIWMSADGVDDTADCSLQSAREWRCRGVDARTRGVLVVLDAEGSVASLVHGMGGDAAAQPVASWGRVVRVVPAGAAEDLADLQATAWKPARSAVRQRSQRFSPTREPAIHVLRLSAIVFWITGRDNDRDAFVQLDGAAFGSVRIRAASLVGGPPEAVYDVNASPPLSLVGRIEAPRGESSEGADVEVFEPLEASGTDRQPLERAALIRRGSTRTAPDGTFAFDGLEPGRYLVSARHPRLGRGTLPVDVPGSPAAVRLAATGRISGRVLRRGLPVAGARIRFVPDPAAWRASADPELLLVEETLSEADGRFVLVLPPDSSGTIQIIDTDGTSIRLPAPSGMRSTETSVGDVAVPDARRATIRLVDARRCDVFAVGPLGGLGLSIVQARAAVDAFWLELPEPGQWALSAECGGDSYSLDPPVIEVPADGPEPAVDARIASSG